jgi:Tol biopolymer transport system component
MTDLDHRFEALSRARPPELWSDIKGREPRPLPSLPTRRRALAVVVALAVAAAGLGVAALTFGGSEHPKRTAAAVSDGRIAFAGLGETTWNIYMIEPDGGHLTMLTDLTGQVADEPAWSPDGQRIAYVVRESNGASDIWVINADGSGAYALTSGPGSSWGPTWSPDGSRLAYTHSAPGRADQIWVVGADGSNPRPFTYCDPPECVQDGSPAWSPDGSRIAFVRVSGAGAIIPVSVFVWPLKEAGPKPEATSLEGATWAADLAWSPDASKLTFARSTSDGASFGLWQMDADGSHLGPLGDRPSAQSPSWSPDGRQIAFMAPVGAELETLYVMDADGTGVRQIPGLPENATSPSWQPIPSDQPAPTPGPMANGPIYFRVGGGEGGSRIESIDPDGTDRRVVFPEGSPVHYSRIAFSPDGTRIVFDDFLSGAYGIMTADPEGGNVVRLTDGVNDSWAAWSPDGSKILFSSTSYDASIGPCEPGFPHEFGCPTDIYVMDADGSNVTRLTEDPRPEFMPVWSPDGSRIAFVREADPVPAAFDAIFTMDPDGTDVRQVSSADGGSDFWPSWSPDGSTIVFAAIRREDWGIWAVDADGSNERMILGGMGAGYVDNPVWSPDGTLIAFVGNLAIDDYSPDDALYVMRPDGSNVTPIADAPGIGVAGDIAWQPIPARAATLVPTPAPSPSEPATVEVRVTTTHGVAEFPTAVAAGEGGVWVTAQRQDGSGAGNVIRLSPETGEVVASVEVRAAPGWEFGGAGITVANGSVWVVGEVGGGQSCCHAFVTRIDASTNEVTDEIELPGGRDLGNDVWVDGDAMYVLMFVDGATELELAKLDIETHATTWRVPIPGQWSQTVYMAGGSVWVLGTHPDAHGPIEVDTLYRLDPGTGAIVDQIPLPSAVFAYIPSVAPETVWFLANDGIQRFDTASAGLVGDPIEPGQGCCGGPFVSDGAGGVWVSSAGADADRSIWHIDTSGAVDASGTIPSRKDFENMQGQSYAFDPATQTIWVQHYEDSVSRVEIVVSPSDLPD